MEQVSIEKNAAGRARGATRGDGTSRTPTAAKAKRIAGGLIVYAIVTALTLFVVDRALIAMDLFPPTYNYGHPVVGWVSARASGRMVEERCSNVATGQSVAYTRNEDGMRTLHSARDLRNNPGVLKLAVSGDSHTELCEPHEKVHFGVMERELNALALESAVFANGAGKYSPLQAYLAVREPIRQYAADAFVLNFYTGNDFLDMLRIDDRPYLEPNGNGYRIAEPVWYQLDSPEKRRNSRVLFLMEAAYENTGLRRVLLRVDYLGDIASSQNAGVLAVAAYMNDLRKASSKKVEYPDAFTAQMLNQQLFFHHFPGSREESLRRVKAVLELVRQENPDRLLVMSPIPSYQLVSRSPVDPAFVEVISRLPITYESGVAEEFELYQALRRMAVESGWLFVDNLPLLREHPGTDLFYNRTDYHIEPVVSEIIGREQARAIANACGARTVGGTRNARMERPGRAGKSCDLVLRQRVPDQSR
jgi:hypothetical protein